MKTNENEENDNKTTKTTISYKMLLFFVVVLNTGMCALN